MLTVWGWSIHPTQMKITSWFFFYVKSKSASHRFIHPHWLQARRNRNRNRTRLSYYDHNIQPPAPCWCDVMWWWCDASQVCTIPPPLRCGSRSSIIARYIPESARPEGRTATALELIHPSKHAMSENKSRGKNKGQTRWEKISPHLTSLGVSPGIFLPRSRARALRSVRWRHAAALSAAWRAGRARAHQSCQIARSTSLGNLFFFFSFGSVTFINVWLLWFDLIRYVMSV